MDCNKDLDVRSPSIAHRLYWCNRCQTYTLPQCAITQTSNLLSHQAIIQNHLLELLLFVLSQQYTVAQIAQQSDDALRNKVRTFKGCVGSRSRILGKSWQTASGLGNSRETYQMWPYPLSNSHSHFLRDGMILLLGGCWVVRELVRAKSKKDSRGGWL